MYTKGDWQIDKASYTNSKELIIENDKGLFICLVNSDGGIEEARANTKRIVKCVNSHDKMVDILRMILENDTEQNDVNDWDSLMFDAQEAIK